MSVLFPLKILLETSEDLSLEHVNFENGPNLRRGESLIPDLLATRQEYDRKLEIIHCLSSIVDDAIDQIHILSGGKKYEKTMDEFKQSLEERATKSFIDDPIYDLETGDPYKVAFRKKKIKKVVEDSAKVKEFLILIRNELRDFHSYKSVQVIMQNIQRRRNEEKELLHEEAENFAKMKSLKHMLITQTRDCQKEMQKVNESYAIARDQTQDLLFENLIRVRYIQEWEDARNEQNTLLCQKGESELENIISKYKSEIEKEIRINTEIELYLHENLKDMEREIEEWMKRYDREIESRNVEIQLIKERREDQQVAYISLKETYETHQKQIDDYLAHKEKKRKEEEKLQKLNVAATKIQAWWRGIMVRHKLGPFNPNKGKKGKDRRKSKKKKK